MNASFRRSGAPIADSSGKDLKELLTAGVFLVKPNLNELRIFSGRELTEETEMEEETKRIVRNGFAQVVFSIGTAGVLHVSGKEQGRVRPPTVPIRSKVGTRDSTGAGITLALARGKGLLDAVRFGVAAGASAVMTPGTELCRREDTERLYAILTAIDTLTSMLVITIRDQACNRLITIDISEDDPDRNIFGRS